MIVILDVVKIKFQNLFLILGTCDIQLYNFIKEQDLIN